MITRRSGEQLCDRTAADSKGGGRRTRKMPSCPVVAEEPPAIPEAVAPENGPEAVEETPAEETVQIDMDIRLDGRLGGGFRYRQVG